DNCALVKVTKDFSLDERSALFHGTAVKAYRLTTMTCPPENDTRYSIVKRGEDGQKKVHSGTNYYDDISVSLKEASENTLFIF
ncbi:hypothetical protein ACFLT4_07060, partial [Chloroflexota bacterium]